MSKRNGSQTPENQLRVLREFAGRSGWTIAREFVECETGSTMLRPELRNMMTAADRKEFDLLLFWRLDRLTRTGIVDTLDTLNKLDRLGIGYHSHQEELIRNTGPMGQLMVAILATVASIEREAISERTKAGMERARSAGKKIGRPHAIANRDKMQQARDSGLSLSAIARIHQVSKATAQRLTTGTEGRPHPQPAHLKQSQPEARC